MEYSFFKWTLVSQRDVKTEDCKCVSTEKSHCRNASKNHNMSESRVIVVDFYSEISNESQKKKKTA